VDPELVLENTPAGLQVVFRGRRLYGPAPSRDAARRVSTRTIPPDTLVLWTSPVVWHGWTELLSKLQGSSMVLACESEPLLLELARRRLPELPQEARERLSLVSADPAEILSAYRSSGQRRFRRVLEVTTGAGAMLHRDHYRTIQQMLEREIRVFWQNAITLAALGRLWVHNLIDNLPQLISAESPPSGLGPTLVCGAGPSLEQAIPLLVRHRRRLVLVAVDTALPVLAARDIVPDYVVALEAQIANLYDFLPVHGRDYGLFVDLTAHPATARLHSRRIWTITRFAPVRLLERISAIPGLAIPVQAHGSVGVTAVSLAMRRGASPLLCAGLDFAVQPGKTHARGAPSFRHEFVHATRLRPARDRGLGARLISTMGRSGPVPTTLILKGYADELAALTGPRADVYAVAPFGPPFASALTIEQADALLADLPVRSRSDPTTHGPNDYSRVIRRFVLREIELLERVNLFDDHTEALTPECDYLACAVADRIESSGEHLSLAPLDRSSRARLEVARSYFLSRWKNALRRVDDS
jgi:hypothetical protein